MRKKKGSITEMEKILWKPIEEDHSNLATIETHYMEKWGMTDCSQISGAKIMRTMARDYAEILRKRASAIKSATSKREVECD